MTNKKRVLFYSSVKDKELFNIQRFYQVDISLLEQLGYQVLLSNTIRDAWKFWKYDFVFAYFYRYSFFVALIARFFRKNTYFTGGIDALDKKIVTKRDYCIQKLFFRLCYFVSRNCIIVSKADEANVKNIVGGKKLSYSEHTIETKSLVCEKYNKENIFLTIGWQANIENVQRKGIDTAIRLFEKLIKMPQFHNYLFYIIGRKGEGSIYLEKIVNQLGVGNSVIFTDSISEKEKIDFLIKGKYYFQLSKYEGFGVAALEALCAKDIVIHSGRGGLGNPIYKDGILVNINKPIDEMFEDLKKDLLSFDLKHLELASQSVCKGYDNERRKKDLHRIIIE